MPPPKDPRICQRCDKRYAPTSSRQRFCVECGVYHRAAQKRKHDAARKNKPPLPPVIPCKDCGKECPRRGGDKGVTTCEECLEAKWRAYIARYEAVLPPGHFERIEAMRRLAEAEAPLTPGRRERDPSARAIAAGTARVKRKSPHKRAE